MQGCPLLCFYIGTMPVFAETVHRGISPDMIHGNPSYLRIRDGNICRVKLAGNHSLVEGVAVRIIQPERKDILKFFIFSGSQVGKKVFFYQDQFSWKMP